MKLSSEIQPSQRRVAPHAGVWIETLVLSDLVNTLVSPPTRGCGLKLFGSQIALCRLVAPHAGVWIETAVWS